MTEENHNNLEQEPSTQPSETPVEKPIENRTDYGASSITVLCIVYMLSL